MKGLQDCTHFLMASYQYTIHMKSLNCKNMFYGKITMDEITRFNSTP